MFKHLCTPAMVYFVLSMITILLALLNRMSALSIIIKLFFVLLWTWFLNYLCKKGHAGISWFLVLLPFIMIVLTVVFSLETLKMATR